MVVTALSEVSGAPICMSSYHSRVCGWKSRQQRNKSANEDFRSSLTNGSIVFIPAVRDCSLFAMSRLAASRRKGSWKAGSAVLRSCSNVVILTTPKWAMGMSSSVEGKSVRYGLTFFRPSSNLSDIACVLHADDLKSIRIAPILSHDLLYILFFCCQSLLLKFWYFI